ncbi:hypothetical protein [Thiomonas sp.]|jgi:hypothetical protein|uniref:hypothetical protein n=1 Tax=Thiomonas sp. TaxID=2047785 RepID=UPI001776675E|nr:hypothetical protein [Thiomonas sp.]
MSADLQALQAALRDAAGLVQDEAQTMASLAAMCSESLAGVAEDLASCQVPGLAERVGRAARVVRDLGHRANGLADQVNAYADDAGATP